MSYASVIEPYRAANVLSGAQLYRWVHVSVDGLPARASNGASVSADQAVGDAVRCDLLFVFAGGDPERFGDTATFAWLRRIARSGATVAGISGGPLLMARAGLLDGYQATVHWEHLPTLLEQFVDVTVEPSLYVIDRRRVTCAGGTAGLDLAIELISRDHGVELAVRVSDWFIQTEVRGADRPQRIGLRDRYGVSDPRVLRALALMESAIERPMRREALADAVHVSLRQLERLFRASLGVSVSRQYLRMRLEIADRMLRRTSLAITRVALAAGFSNIGYFSTVYRDAYGLSPRQRRNPDKSDRGTRTIDESSRGP